MADKVVLRQSNRSEKTARSPIVEIYVILLGAILTAVSLLTSLILENFLSYRPTDSTVNVVELIATVSSIVFPLLSFGVALMSLFKRSDSEKKKVVAQMRAQNDPLLASIESQLDTILRPKIESRG